VGPLAPERPVIGREAERARLLANVARGRHTLLVGPIGAGKTHLLRDVAQELPHAVYVPHVQPLRLCLLGLSECLHARGQLVLAGGTAAPEAWPECARFLHRVTVRELTAVVVASLRARLSRLKTPSGLSLRASLSTRAADPLHCPRNLMSRAGERA
jgi:AAA ATPase domain